MYTPVRTPSGALSDVPEANGDAPEGIEGGVRASDCHQLLRDHAEAEGGDAGVQEGGGGGGEEEHAATPR